MSIDQLPSSQNEYDKNQQMLATAVSEAEELLKRGSDDYLAKIEQTSITPDEDLAELRKTNGLFDLPDGEGRRKLSVRMPELVEIPGPESVDVVMEARHQEWLANKRHMTVYTVSKMSGGELVLEVRTEDVSQVDKHRALALKALDRAVLQGKAIDLTNMFENALLSASEESKVVQATAEERAFGLHEAQPEDSRKLRSLIQEASVQLETMAIRRSLEALMAKALETYENGGDDGYKLAVDEFLTGLQENSDVPESATEHRAGLLFLARQGRDAFEKVMLSRVEEILASVSSPGSERDTDDPGTETLLW